MILLAINYVNYSDGGKKIYQDRALTILEKNRPSNCTCVTFNFSDEHVTPPSFLLKDSITRDSSKTIRNNRKLPYIKEILNACCDRYNADIFGYMNSDILLPKSFFSLLNLEHDAYLFQRFEVMENADLTVFTKKGCSLDNIIKYSEEHHGYDAVFFKKTWWQKYRRKFNEDLILGEPLWDWYYHKVTTDYTKNALEKRALYHVYHTTTWNTRSPGALNNDRILNGGKP